MSAGILTLMADASPTTCERCGQKLPLAERIKDVLADGDPKTARKIWATLGENTTTLMSVRQTCRRMRDKQQIRVVKEGGTGSVQGWVLVPRPA